MCNKLPVFKIHKLIDLGMCITSKPEVIKNFIVLYARRAGTLSVFKALYIKSMSCTYPFDGPSRWAVLNKYQGSN